MNVIINNKEIPLEVMDTPSSIRTGMMGRDHLDGGMLFMFDDVSERSFWMMDCLIPLDVIFIVGNKVTKVHNNCEPCNGKNCKSYFGVADKVLELPSGEVDVNVGDILNLVD
jgi:uncharacterized membrane protein (UPF0127 family)